MIIQRANSATFDVQIAYYRNKSLDELQRIIPVWAHGNNADKIYDAALRPERKEFCIFIVNTKELINASIFFEVNPEIMFTGVPLNDVRVSGILNRWDHQQFIDPPTVVVYDTKNRLLSFSDGRHRTKTAFLLGSQEIPIAVHISQIDIISSFISLVEIK